MSRRGAAWLETLAMGGLAAGAGAAVTYAVEHYAPFLWFAWFAWFASGGLIAFLLSGWKPRRWIVIGLCTPSVVLMGILRELPDTPPTAAALRLGFGLFWALLSRLGAFVGRTVAPTEEDAG